MLVFKTVIYNSKLFGFKDFTSLELKHSESNTKLYGLTQFKICRNTT